MLDSNNTFKASCGGVLSALCFGLAGVGLLRSVACTTGALRFLWRKHLRPGKKLNSYGEWAVVTGASDGIGRAYCDYLARQGVSNAGLNIFLVSRTKAKLETAAAEIGQEHDVKTRIFAVDLAIAGSQGLDAEVWANLRTAVAGMDVAVLVNNAATIQRHPSDFHMLDAGSIDYTVSLNDTAILKLTHLVLPGMVERGRGAIVNISTIVCKFPAAPQLALYTASKSFLNTFTKALAAEYGPKGIHVQVQLPGPVATSLVPTGTPESGFMPSPKDFVAHAGRHIGYETVCIPYPHHAVATCIAQLLPKRMIIGGFKLAMQDMRATAEALDAERGATPGTDTEG